MTTEGGWAEWSWTGREESGRQARLGVDVLSIDCGLRRVGQAGRSIGEYKHYTKSALRAP